MVSDISQGWSNFKTLWSFFVFEGEKRSQTQRVLVQRVPHRKKTGSDVFVMLQMCEGLNRVETPRGRLRLLKFLELSVVLNKDQGKLKPVCRSVL